MKKISTADAINKIIRDNLVQENRMIDLHNTIKRVWQPWTGKTLNKRAARQLEAALGAGSRVNLVAYGAGPFVRYNVTVHGVAGFEQPGQHATFYLFDLDFSPEKFDKENPASGSAAISRNNSRCSTLSTGGVERIAETMDKYIAAKAKLDRALADIDDKAEIERFFKIRD